MAARGWDSLEPGSFKVAFSGRLSFGFELLWRAGPSRPGKTVAQLDRFGN
jgi:hypothetical protein